MLRPRANREGHNERNNLVGLAWPLSLCALALLAVGWPKAALAQSNDVWTAATIVENGKPSRRFIPFQLWSGAQWDGTFEIVDYTVSRTDQPENNPPITIHGPIASEFAPGQVYERSRKSPRLGVVYQLFQINRTRDGVAMVYQNRGGKISKQTITENKFPLGWWAAGEARTYDDQGRTTITIEDLDFVYRGRPHSIKFHWTTNLESDNTSHYIYSPGIGLAWSKE